MGVKNMTNEAKLYNEVEAMQAKKIKAGQLIAIGVIVLYTVIGTLILMQSANALPIIMGVVVLLFAPVTAMFYIRDVKRGVFKPTPEEEAEYEEMLRQNAEEKAAQQK